MLSPFLPNRVNVFVNYLECRWNKLNRSHIILVMGLDQGDVSLVFWVRLGSDSFFARTHRQKGVSKEKRRVIEISRSTLLLHWAAIYF